MQLLHSGLPVLHLLLLLKTARRARMERVSEAVVVVAEAGVVGGVAGEVVMLCSRIVLL